MLLSEKKRFLFSAILIFTVEIKGQDESEPEVCKAVDKKTCNFKKQVLCCSPPEAGGICPQYECFSKQYKGEKKKKCSTKCPIHCDEDNVRCDGPVDKKGCYEGDLCIPHNPMCNVTHCPIFCGNGKHECPSGFYPNGCPMEPECVKSNKPCPTFCQDDEVECQVNGQIVCIPDNMDINCPPLCPPDCDEDEKACDGPPATAAIVGPPLTPATCEGESFCIEKFDGVTGCGNTCPIYCLPGFKSCPIAYNDFGCLLEGYEGSACFPIEEDCPEVIDSCPDGRQTCLLSPDLDIHGCILSEHPLTGCPIECPEFCQDGERKCNGMMGSDGCLMSQSCIPLMDNETGCENYCPMGCPPGNIHCPGYSQSWNNNCTSSGYCIPEISAYNGCPNFCYSDPQCDYQNENQCQSYDENGCMNGSYCSPSTDPATGCYNHCPVVCKQNETYCGGHAETWYNNCSSHAYCLPQILDDGCPSVCHDLGPDSLECDVNEMICYEYNENGCQMDQFCGPSWYDATGCANSCPCTGDSTTCDWPDYNPNDSCPAKSFCVGNPGGCPGVCQVVCDEGNQTCYNSFVDSNGCHLHEPYCYPAQNTSTGCGLPCPPNEGEMNCYQDNSYDDCQYSYIQNTTDSNGCPNICNPECSQGEMACPGSPDENGCPTEEVCIDLSNNMEGSCGCPDFTVCPANTTKCPISKYLNPYTNEACYSQSVCIPPPSPFFAHCDLGMTCPTVCMMNETYCDLGTDEDGCPLGGICVPYTGLDECSVCPPISCGGNTKVCDAVTDGSTGCSQETCSLPLVGTCPDDTICSPDCPDDFIPCYAPSELAACPAYIKSCIPAVDPMDGCPNFCPVFCDPVTAKICDGVGFLPGTSCSQPDYCVPIGTSCN